MNFSDICFRFTLISGSENHKSHDIFSFILFISIKLFMAFGSSFSAIFGKLQERNSVTEFIICQAAVHRTETFS